MVGYGFFILETFFFIGFNLGCAFAPSTGALIGFRFLAGCAGSTSQACGGGVIADLFDPNSRALAMALYSVGPLLGPVLGPIVGGYLVQAVGIKWIFIVISAFAGAIALVALPLLRETYAPLLLLRRLQRVGDPERHSSVQTSLPSTTNEKIQIIWLNLSRPVVLLFTNFICFVLALYMAFVTGIYYLMFTTFGTLFSEVYGFGPGSSGLTYIGLGVGFILAAIIGAKFGNQVYLNLAAKNGGQGKPEYRLPPLIVASFLVPIGLFWYGWSAQARIHWIMPIIGTGIFGFALMTTYLPIQLYLADAFTYAASALSAASLIRGVLGFAFPLFGQDLYNKLHDGPGNSLLAGIAIILGIPFSILIYFYGEKIRERGNTER